MRMADFDAFMSVKQIGASDVALKWDSLVTKVKIIRPGIQTNFGKKLKLGDLHLIIALTWLQKFLVVMSSLPSIAWNIWPCADVTNAPFAFVYFTFLRMPNLFLLTLSNMASGKLELQKKELTFFLQVYWQKSFNNINGFFVEVRWAKKSLNAHWLVFVLDDGKQWTHK